MSILIVIPATTMASVAHAATSSSLDLSGLSDEEKTTVREKLEEIKKAQSPLSDMIPSAGKLSQWASLGQQFGAGIAQTAKELGVTANEFINTPVGRMVAIVIVWKLIGGALVHIIGGVIFFLIALIIWLRIFNRLCLVKSVKEVPGRHFFWLIQNKEFTYYGTNEVDTERVTMSIFAISIVILTLFIIFSY